jgi:subtilisin family serine protease
METILTNTTSPFALDAGVGLTGANGYGLTGVLDNPQVFGTAINLSHATSLTDLEITNLLAEPTIVAIAQGNPTPATDQYPNPVTNGDFLLRGNSIATLVGDGLDEFTTWDFDLTRDPDFTSLTTTTLLASAELTLTLKPTFGVDTDGLTIQGLGSIVKPIRELPVGQTSTITINLLDYFSPDTVVKAIQNNAGKLSTTYQDDAIVSFAKLELSTFDSGIFTVGDTGQVSVDFLADGGMYAGELAMFSLEGMGQYKPGSTAFIQEAARRALTNSTLGHVAIADQAEGARFSGILGAHEYQDWNTGAYSGNKTFLMNPGDRFGFMLIPDGWTSEVFENPAIAGSKQPLFSMATSNLDSPFSIRQFADVTGDRTTFAGEDLKLPNSDRDYNDIIFQVKGATGGAVHVDELIDPAKEWRNSRVGQELVQSVVDPLDPAGETVGTARKVNVSTSGRSYRGWVGGIDTDDYYSFSLGVRHEFSLTLDGLTTNANVELLDLNGNVIQSSTNSGTTAESINATLEAGAYRIRVTSLETRGTPFNLGLTATPLIAGITTTGSDVPAYLNTQESIPLIGLDVFHSADPNLGSDPRFAGIDGSGFSTVIIDTGINLNHPFFGGDSNGDEVSDRIVYHFDYADSDANADDVDGHGSNVASIAASSDATFSGMAPGANIIALKVFEDDGGSTYGYIERALQWVLANAATFNIASVNMSLEDGLNHTTLQRLYGIDDELALLAANGVTVVAASGNSFATPAVNSTQGVAYPSADPNVLSVGSVWDGGNWWFDVGNDENINNDILQTSVADQIAATSQRHVTLTDIFAPGHMIVGAGNDGNPELRVNNTNVQAFENGTLELGGTSMAAPHIAGMAVLSQQLAQRVLGRSLTPTEFQQLLYDTGVQINDPQTGVTSFRRANMLALANAIAGPGPIGNTHTVTITPTIQRYEPPRTRGDDEFDGHGPAFRIETSLGSNRSSLWTSVFTFFEETEADWTTFGGTSDQRLIFNVEEQFPGWEIASVDTPTFDILTGVDNDHDVNDYYPAFPSLVEHYAVQGDTRQTIFNPGSDQPWVTVFFNPIQVTLRRIT